MTPARIAVVLPVHNRRDTTLRALRSLARTDPRDADLRLVVLDDGSTDGTGDAIRASGLPVTIVDGSGSLYYAGGTNAGVTHALQLDPDFIVVGNDDAIFGEGCVKALLDCARRHARAVVGAMLLRWDLPHLTFQVGQRWDTWYGGWHVPQALSFFACPTTPWCAETLPGNCILLPAAAVREVGLLDARRFPHHGADAEFCGRLRRAGWQLIVEPRARVFCEPNTNPTPLHQLDARALLRVLVRTRVHPMHLPTTWRVRVASAPTRLQGVAAAAVFTARLGLRAVGVGSWPRWPDPRPAFPAPRS